MSNTPTTSDLITSTNNFLDIHWNHEKLGPLPNWSEQWNFEGPIPNHKYRGCYAFFNGQDELVYIGIGLGKNKAGRYIGHGLGNRLNRIWKTASKGKYVQESGYEYVNHIRTISFENDISSPFWLAAALEIYLITQLQPEKNITHNN